jgi:hypothetical protein
MVHGTMVASLYTSAYLTVFGAAGAAVVVADVGRRADVVVEVAGVAEVGYPLTHG